MLGDEMSTADFKTAVIMDATCGEEIEHVPKRCVDKHSIIKVAVKGVGNDEKSL